MEKEITATHDSDSKRYHSFTIDEGQEGVNGAIYIPKCRKVSDSVTISLKTRGEKRGNGLTLMNIF
jgi:hypothetical protein